MYIFLMILTLVIAIAIYFGLRSLFEYKRPYDIYMIVKDAFTSLVKRHKLSIAEVNLFGNRLIAIDYEMNKLVLIHYKHGIAWEKCLNLHEMVFCRVAKILHKVSGDIQKVHLELTMRKGGVITFSFFDEGVDVLRDLPIRLKNAQYWKGKIQCQISTVQLTNVD